MEQLLDLLAGEFATASEFAQDTFAVRRGPR